MILNAFLLALREIRRNRTRTLLTALGIIIGVSAVVSLVTLGGAAKEAVRGQISSLGSNLLIIRPGNGVGPRVSTAGVPLFTAQDVTIIGEQIYGIAGVAPVRSTSFNTIYRQHARRTAVTGTTDNYFAINNWQLAQGRLFDAADLRTGAAVCVLGDTVRRELFGDADPLGAKIRIGKTPCTVIGLLASKGQAGLGDQDDTIVVPMTTLQRRLVGQQSINDISQIAVSLREGSDPQATSADITRLLRERRNLQPNQENDFSVFDTRQIADTLGSSIAIMTALLSAVAAISLIVGGIGIMNIMLVAVTERTREIGIRLSIGATAQEVLLQFLVEAVTLSCVGGLIGLVLAFGATYGLAALTHLSFVFDPQINLIAFGFSAAIGVIFGFAPARRAARLDPVDALRHE